MWSHSGSTFAVTAAANTDLFTTTGAHGFNVGDLILFSSMPASNSLLVNLPYFVVEKTTTDNSKQKALEETIQKIRTELQLKNKEINDLKNTITDIQASNGRQGIFLDGSNLNRTINNRK